MLALLLGGAPRGVRGVLLCFGNLNLSVESEFLPAKGIWISSEVVIEVQRR